MRRRGIALDTSALSQFLDGAYEARVDDVAALLSERRAYLSPVVATEVLSRPRLPEDLIQLVQSLPLLEIHDGYWYRAGLLRARVKRDRLKANLADTLIAQSCIDHDIPLITYDRDFRHFVRAGLTLV
ncbi:MAG TPA: PIN domain-containing protein [Thermoanaerobaculia bacterium]